MEECGSTGCEHPWKAATMKRKAWALSRGSWQASESQDGHTEGQPPQEPTPQKEPLAEEPGRIPSKIASWLKECRTPLGASLDEQSSTPAKGPVKHTCSFEDDLSLGAEANHLRAGRTPSEIQRLGMLAQEKRTQFQQKGRSMNSTGSGKSNTTVSSVSELLDLYEEDPEEILYNLGFGREEPDIASKIPSRFFNSTSHARGIDIKVYLGAQLQRLELENPNYALTSRFRQIEVLTTVANAFSSLYSQVSGTPVQKIGSSDSENKEPAVLIRNSSALNAAKILKKTVTRRNLLAAVDGTLSARPEAEGAKGPGEGDHEQAAKAKDQPSLATVSEAEESHQGAPGVLPNGDLPNGDLPNGDKGEAGKEPDPRVTADPDSDTSKEQAVTSTPAKEFPASRLHTCLTHLLSQTKDSFEMEEVQSNEGEGPAGISSSSKDGNEILMRMESQHSDSSGFAEDPSTEGSATHLKVQESSDSCDSETTVTSNAGELSTPLALDHPAFQKLQGEEDCLMAIGSESTLALDHPSFPKLLGEEEGLPAIGSDNIATVDHPSFQKLPGEEEGLKAIGSESTLSLDHSAFHKLEGKREGQMAVGSDNTGELNADLQSGNPCTPKRVEEEVVEEGEVIQEKIIGEEVDEKVAGKNVVQEEVVEEGVVEGKVIAPKYIPHQTPQPTEKEIHMHTPKEASTSEVPSSPTEPDVPAQIGSAADPGSGTAACQEHGTLVCSRVRDLQQGRDRYPLRRASSLPSSLLSPSRVVSSVKIQFRPGSTQQCTPPSFSYCYTPEDDGEGSIAEKEEEEVEDEERAPCRSTLIINTAPKGSDIPAERRAEDTPASGMRPYPLHFPSHLTRSSCSLHSTPSDWPDRPLCDLPRTWSTCSMPALSAHSAPYGSPLGHPNSAPYNSTLGHPHGAPYGSLLGHPHSAPSSLPLSHPHNGPYSLSLGHPHSASYNPTLGHPHSAPYNSTLGYPHGASYSSPLGHPHGAPYSSPLSHPHSAPYSLPFGHPHSASNSSPLGHPHSAPYGSPLGHPHSASYSSFFNQPHGAPNSLPLSHPQSAPSHYGIPQSNRCNSPFNPSYSTAYGAPCLSNCCPSFPSACSPLAASHTRLAQPPSSTEMQLKRVLHDVRSAMQNLTQGSSLLGEDIVTPRFSPSRAVQPLYEDTIQELQVIKRNLNVFRTQMMDLELALLRQQDMVYQHLTEEDRQEAEHLQSLRTAVRQELHELELQLEDRLLFLDEQLRTSPYRHPVGISRGHSLDSRCSTPPMNVTEPVTELLREQLSLQAELGFEGKASCALPLASNCSSGSVSPVRQSRPLGPPVPDCPSPRRPEVYRTSVCLTPTLPPRQQVPRPPQRTDVPTCSLPEDQGGAEAANEGGAAENPQLQELIKEIKRSITDEIRQEIVSDLLAAVLPRRSPAATQEHTL